LGSCAAATNVSASLTSARLTVTEKKKRRAVTAPLIIGGRAPLFVRCN
jgi:hypothetical protein